MYQTQSTLCLGVECGVEFLGVNPSLTKIQLLQTLVIGSSDSMKLFLEIYLEEGCKLRKRLWKVCKTRAGQHL